MGSHTSKRHQTAPPPCKSDSVKKPTETRGTRFNAALKACHWSVRHVAPLIQWDDRTVRHWLSGRYEPPEEVLVWIETLAEVHNANPPPQRRRQESRE